MSDLQAKDITDDEVIEAVRATQGMHGVPQWSSLWDIQEMLSAFPAKVVLAKLRALVKKGKIRGCACGCRGDFELPRETKADSR